MKICVSKLIKIVFIICATSTLIIKDILAMQAHAILVDTPKQAYVDIVKTHSEEFTRQRKENPRVNLDLFIENLIADLLELRKKISDGHSQIPNEMIADTLLMLGSPKFLNFPSDFWYNDPERIAQYFPPPLDNDVFEILTMARYKQILSGHQ